MTSPESSSHSRPAKAAGLALLGVAGAALTIGVVSLFGGGYSSPNAGGTTTPQPTSAAPGASSTDPASSTATSGTALSSTAAGSATTAPTTAPGHPGSAAASAPATNVPAASTPPVAANAEVPASRPPVRVYNNSTITGLAGRASDDVRRYGWEVAETGNYSQGQIPTTTVYFRPGTDEEQSAKTLGALLQARVEPRFDGIQGAHPGVILIVTNDYKSSQPK
ncbi:MAG TPA: LytR C-terminal domain-containing protein [Pseudonocardiaceae bacterium]|nr:LytR C-terminal domain-containing protein [Pseudonocardiaceae bacterium]